MENELEDSCSIFSLTDNLSNSYVDTSKLLSYFPPESTKEIGMSNFKSKRKHTPTILINPIVHKNSLQNTVVTNNARSRWRQAALKAKLLCDPWVEFKLESYPTENAIRHRYNAIKKEWIKDECKVKMENTQFAKGAMRACFRLKKLTNSIKKLSNSWEHASNYVAKCYMDPEIPRERYFDDVKLQMDAKLWSEIYNRHNPPKKIDMFQVSILEFKDRPNSPLYHLEHYIEGEYIKYNSNSGFVDEHIRYTPHAFSHFTFEKSNHDLIVVDIQGVGDLYTDPQIHTALGTDYGDGNLGIKGFALFFSSHVCNDVCRSLGLTPFDLAPRESKNQEKIINCMQKCSFTHARGMEELVVGSPSSCGEYFKRIRRRSDTSGCSDDNNSIYNDLPDISENIDSESSLGYESSSNSPLLSPNLLGSHVNSNQFSSSQPIPIGSHHPPVRIPRVRNESSCLDSAFSLDEAANYFNSKLLNKPRASCVYAEKNLLDDNDENDEYLDYHHKMKNRIELLENEESTLGKIHLELCKYHEIGRFLVNENDEIDQESSLFHLKQAANLGINEALVNCAKIYLNLPREILPSYKLEESDSNLSIGFEYMLQSAEKNDKNSMFYIAKAFDTGYGLPKDRTIDWSKSYEFYQKILNMGDEENAEDSGYFEANSECDPLYVILARMAEMNLNGGNNFEKDPNEAASLYTEAGDKAMACGKGRLANKYYMLSEEAASCAD